ncbi:MAG: hypothetical protein IPL96_09985 [Holophagaceae bacterium]|nr:hypothetical protein [Holophagaceae bacterium]
MLRKLFLVVFSALSVLAGSPDGPWEKVQEAINKGLPKTAIAELEPIIQGAVKKKAYGEAIKAIGLRIALEGNIQGNKPEEKITRMQAEVAKAPDEMKPVMEAILANWYWHYFQRNRWRFLQRTQTAEAPGQDFTTWDLPRILAGIDKQFSKALSHEQLLKATPVSEYDELLLEGSVPDAYRPTMFDFIAHNALEFYCAGEQGAAKSEDSFEISTDSPIFAASNEFLKWKPNTTDVASPTLKALRLYQELLAFHRDDKAKTALADADLLRLTFGYNRAVGDDKDARFKAALKRFAEEWRGHEVSARALAAWARVLQREQGLVEARRLAERGLKAFPDTVGGSECFNIIREIDAKAASIQTERVWNAPLPTIDVRYRNITKVYFRAVGLDFETDLKAQRWGLNQYDRSRNRALLDRAPSLAWNADLPATRDYKDRTERVPAPKGLKPGFYFVFASHDPSFMEDNNLVSVAPVWVSDLALVVRHRPYEGFIDGFVLNALTGEPIAGAKVTPWERDRDGWFQRSQTVFTDANGMFKIAEGKDQYGAVVLFAEHQGQQVSTANEVGFSGPSDPEQADSQTVFFTDRSLYRPGQTISYKGICIRFDQSRSNYETLAGKSLTVIFRDPNGKEIEQRTHTCNDQGAFSGTFTAPRDRVTGGMSIHATGAVGSTQIRVEEYKRPKFQVELSAPKEAAKLNGEVVVTGKATAYTGAAIGGANVKWRVVREVQFPSWCWWSYGYWSGDHQASQALGHGSSVTENDGTFKVSFTARPDLAIAEKDEPVFHYTVFADVTDTSGETRSEKKTVRVGYTTLQASLLANEWQTMERPVELNLQTTTLDGEGQVAEGTLTVHALKQPGKVQRDSLTQEYPHWDFLGGYPSDAKADPSNPDSWELGDVMHAKSFKTNAAGNESLSLKLKAGIYRAELQAKDRFGKRITARLTLRVLDPAAKRHPIKVPDHFTAPKWSVEPGETFQALWGTGYDQGRAFVEVECRGKILKSFWTAPGATQELIRQAVKEDLRGGFTLRVTSVRENRAYFNERIVDVPWSNKQLSVKWEHFTSKLGPGQKETWTALITAPDAKKAAAEMVAGLYDASLDQYLPHNWTQAFNCFRREIGRTNSEFQNYECSFQQLSDWREPSPRSINWRYRGFPQEVIGNLWGYRFMDVGNRKSEKLMPAAAPAPSSQSVVEVMASAVTMDKTTVRGARSSGNLYLIDGMDVASPKPPPPPPPPTPDLSKVTARKNLSETAFFFPNLLSDRDGVVRMEFTMPEALTEWKFLGFAHDKELRSGFLTGRAVTAKDLMVEPNPPRFLREGDVVEFTVKVSNQSSEKQSGRVKLSFSDARTGDSRDALLGNLQDVEKAFEIPAKESRSFFWRITIPDGCEFLAYKAVGATAALSDGEEGFLPVLSRRILVTESLPLPIRGKQEKTFEFAKLLVSGDSSTLRQENLSVQMVSQPAWYAVMALPYLMEFPYECSEQTFNRLYANVLARHIANSDPKIRCVFDQWKGTPALDSPLEKNQDLKMVTLEETPWVRQAQSESQARRNVGVLFDSSRLDEETGRTLGKLTEMQLSDGRWPWFPGGPPSDYITLYVVTGFGRLRHLGADVDVSSAKKALQALDAWMDASYRNILHKELYIPSSTDALYLYGRSFFLKDQAIAAQHGEAVEFFLRQSQKFWLKVENRQSQAHLAVSLARFNAFNKVDDATPKDIMRSIKERSVSSEELGMFWRELELSWWWYRAPIETQAMMVEAFDQVMDDQQAVEDCQVWLLKQKQTQDWKTTKATADAIYALLLKGTNKLSSDTLVEVSLGGEPIKPEHVEAGTGFYEKRFAKGEIKPEMGHVTLKKVDEGVSWGSMHWQYLEDMTKVTPYEGTPLKLKKSLFHKDTTAKGQMLKPVRGSISVGDELVVRVELRVDRDMEYVHLKDQRGSGTEPLNVLSRYKYQDGLAYYESTRDTASHFFIDYLPKGTYVFEYSVRVQLKGKYQTGIASIQCMYAPEFNSHSESLELDVK